jgi:hypothetical protein
VVPLQSVELDADARFELCWRHPISCNACLGREGDHARQPQRMGPRGRAAVALQPWDIHGIHHPFDATERARLIAEVPAFNMDRASTPTLWL